MLCYIPCASAAITSAFIITLTSSGSLFVIFSSMGYISFKRAGGWCEALKSIFACFWITLTRETKINVEYAVSGRSKKNDIKKVNVIKNECNYFIDGRSPDPSRLIESGSSDWNNEQLSSLDSKLHLSVYDISLPSFSVPSSIHLRRWKPSPCSLMLKFNSTFQEDVTVPKQTDIN